MRVIKDKVTVTVVDKVLHPAAFHTRAFFACVYSVLRMMQLMTYTTLTFIAIRSYLFLLARSALYCRSEIDFSLP